MLVTPLSKLNVHPSTPLCRSPPPPQKNGGQKNLNCSKSPKMARSGGQPQWKTTLMEDDLNGRRPQWKTTSIEDDLKGGRLQC